MTTTAILVAGDEVIYRGTAGRRDGVFIMPGDQVSVVEGNEDYDSEALVRLHNGDTLLIPASDLEWIA